MIKLLTLWLAVSASAFAADVPAAQRVKMMDGDGTAANILGTSSHPVRVDPTGTTNQPVTQATSPWLTSRNWTLSNGTDSIAAVESGIWSVRLQDGTGNAVTSQASGGQRPLDTQTLVSGTVVDPRARTWTLSAGTDGVTATQGPAAALSGAWPIKLTDGTHTMPTMDVTARAGFFELTDGTHTAPTMDVAARAGYQEITDGTNTVQLPNAGSSDAGPPVKVGGRYNATLPSLSDGQRGDIQLNAKSAQIVDIYSLQAMPMVNRTDVSQTVTASGNSSTFDTQGMAEAAWNFNVTAISGTGAYIQFHVQTSDDATNWSTYVDTPRLTTTGLSRYQGMRHAGRYYRFTWGVAGTTPSVTFTIMPTLKPYSPTRKSVRFFYADLDLTVNGNGSTPFSADDCRNVSVVFIRGADGGNNGTVQLFASNDSTNWVTISGNLAANVSTTNFTTAQEQAWRYYQLQVTAHTSSGTRTLDVQWSCN